VSPIVATRDSTELLRTDFGTVRIMAGGEQTNNAFTVIEAVVQPGFEVSLHQHDFDESFYIVEGTMTVQVNGETGRVPAGSYVFVPGGAPHGFVNREKAPLRNVVTTTPAALERMFRRRAEELRQQGDPAERP
jgi:quercetin dioxygenase-like cupin family protein